MAVARALISRGDVHLVRLDPPLGSENPEDAPLPGHFAVRTEQTPAHDRCRAHDHWGGTRIPGRIGCRFQKRSGFVALDQLRTVDGERLVKRLGRLSIGTMTDVLKTLQEMFAP